MKYQFQRIKYFRSGLNYTELNDTTYYSALHVSIFEFSLCRLKYEYRYKWYNDHARLPKNFTFTH